jgi:hypothetical protein
VTTISTCDSAELTAAARSDLGGLDSYTTVNELGSSSVARNCPRLRCLDGRAQDHQRPTLVAARHGGQCCLLAPPSMTLGQAGSHLCLGKTS